MDASETRTLVYKPIIPKSGELDPHIFPDFHPRLDVQIPVHILGDGQIATLLQHFGRDSTTLVAYRVPIAWRVCPDPRVSDFVIALDIDAPAAFALNGYAIAELGKPPDFVLEFPLKINDWNREELEGKVFSPYPDYQEKLIEYAEFGIPEYWRFDSDDSLAGDRLVDGVYQPIEIVRADADHHWGHSNALNLDVCWRNGRLRWWDPVTGQYLLTYDEEAAGRIAEAQRADRESQSRIAAEARVRELEAELRRQQNP